MSLSVPSRPSHPSSALHRRAGFLLLAGALGLAAISAHASDGHAPHWTYTGKTGAAKWAGLSQDFAACKLSREQSPIDITTRDAAKAALPALDFGYSAGAAEVINNGHTIQVNLPHGGSLRIGDHAWPLLQFHFHTPSEEKINGKAYPLVAHMVHKDADGKLAVVAVLFKRGKENAALAPVMSALPAEGATLPLASFDPAALLPAGRSYYAFMGSLTTPPCSDGVRWHVLREPVTVSAAQLRAFRKLYPMNARPVQPLNGRKVQVSE